MGLAEITGMLLYPSILASRLLLSVAVWFGLEHFSPGNESF